MKSSLAMSSRSQASANFGAISSVNVLRRHARCLGGLLDLEPVLVGAGQELDVVAEQAVPAGQRVADDRRVGVAEVRFGVDVVDRRRDVEPAHDRHATEGPNDLAGVWTARSGHGFATATCRRAARRRSRPDGAGSVGTVHRYRSEIHPGWDIGGNANGGYVLALAGRAMADAVGRPPLSVTGHYLAPSPPGRCEVDVDDVRAGGRMATCTASIVRPAASCWRVLGTFADHGRRRPRADRTARHRSCRRPTSASSAPTSTASLDTGMPPSGLMYRPRAMPRTRSVTAGEPSGRAETVGWFAFARRRSRSTSSALLMVADAFAPVVFNQRAARSGWSPTLELTVHVRGRPGARARCAAGSSAASSTTACSTRTARSGTAPTSSSPSPASSPCARS